MFAFGNNSLKEISTIWPDGQAVLHKAMSYQIMDFGLPRDSGGRTQKRQSEIYAQGRTKPGKIVTWTLNSNHLIDANSGYGHAFDVVPYINGRYVWDEKQCAILATIILKAAAELGVSIEWGFHLWGKDMPHFQKVGV